MSLIVARNCKYGLLLYDGKEVRIDERAREMKDGRFLRAVASGWDVFSSPNDLWDNAKPFEQSQIFQFIKNCFQTIPELMDFEQDIIVHTMIQTLSDHPPKTQVEISSPWNWIERRLQYGSWDLVLEYEGGEIYGNLSDEEFAKAVLQEAGCKLAEVLSDLIDSMSNLLAEFDNA